MIKEKDFGGKSLYEVRLDPFYYGIFVHGDKQLDLRELHEGLYEPMITEEEHRFLLERYYEHQGTKPLKEIKTQHEPLMPLPPGIVITGDKYHLLFNLPNKNRFYQKLARLKLKNPQATLEQVVENHQIRYRCVNKKSAYYNLEITYDKLEEVIV